MSDQLQPLDERLRRHFGERLLDSTQHCGQLTVEVAPEQLLPICRALRDAEDLGFEQLSDLCGMDYAGYGQADWETRDTTHTGFSRGVRAGVHHEPHTGGRARFAVVYHLLSLKHNARLRLRVALHGEPPRVASVTEVWNGANWYEREAFDLFGILFEGHPDLRRLLTDYGFVGHPLRKDFPLQGEVEVRYDPEQGRVVYQPVSIDNRVLVPRVIRRDNRYLEAETPAASSTG